MTATPTALDFYFDFYSPYAYFTSMKIDALAAKHGREVNWHAILLGPAFKKVGSQPLLDIPLIGDYSRHDLIRSARLENLPLHFPATFPGATLAAARAFYWIYDQDRAQGIRFAKRVCQSAFGEGNDITDPERVANLAAEFGIDRAALLEAMQSTAVKERLKAAVGASLERGVFGSPFIIIDGEAFWGNDRLAQVDEWLARGGW